MPPPTTCALSLCLTLVLGAVLPATAQEPGAKPKPPKDENEKWSLLGTPIVENRFVFHLQGLDGKEINSSQFWGRPMLIYLDVPGSSENAAHVGQAHKVAKEFPDVQFLGIYLVVLEPENGHVRRLRTHLEQAKLSPHPTLLGDQSIRKQFQNVPPTPCFIFVNRDGSVESSFAGWVEGKTTSSEKRIQELLARMSAKPRPKGKAPEPPPLEVIKPVEAYQDPERQAPGGAAE
jgi:hypothetical protein